MEENVEAEEAPGFEENERPAESESEDQARAQQDRLRQRLGGLLYMRGSDKGMATLAIVLVLPRSRLDNLHCFPIRTPIQTYH